MDGICHMHQVFPFLASYPVKKFRSQFCLLSTKTTNCLHYDFKMNIYWVFTKIRAICRCLCHAYFTYINEFDAIQCLRTGGFSAVYALAAHTVSSRKQDGVVVRECVQYFV
jgi:hypothetical protein